MKVSYMLEYLLTSDDIQWSSKVSLDKARILQVAYNNLYSNCYDHLLGTREWYLIRHGNVRSVARCDKIVVVHMRDESILRYQEEHRSLTDKPIKLTTVNGDE